MLYAAVQQEPVVMICSPMIGGLLAPRRRFGRASLFLFRVAALGRLPKSGDSLFDGRFHV